MTVKGKKRAAARAEKLRRKHERYKRGGEGESRYAKKQRGEIVPTPSLVLVWCPVCYRHRSNHPECLGTPRRLVPVAA